MENLEGKELLIGVPCARLIQSEQVRVQAVQGRALSPQVLEFSGAQRLAQPLQRWAASAPKPTPILIRRGRQCRVHVDLTVCRFFS